MIKKYFVNVVFYLLIVGLNVCQAGNKNTKSQTVHGKIVENGTGISGVVVSDGYSTTLSTKSGDYRLVLNDSAEFVFISLPSGYKIPNTNGIAQVYKPVTTGANNQPINFNLQKNEMDDTKHAFIVWADPQVKTQANVERMLTESAIDAALNIKELGNIPVHGITCGDIVFEKFDLYADYANAVAKMGVPFFQVAGNHDLDYKAPSKGLSDKQFKAAFGPTYYSFNRGEIHYIVLNDVLFKANDETYKNARRKYMGYISEEQLSWLKKDLQYVPKGTTLVISVHIPTYKIEYLKSTFRKEFETATVVNRDELYKLVKNYKVHVMSGHTHYNEVVEQGDMIEHNHAAVCGAWWVGDICTDGTPFGYGIYQVDGDNISWYFEPTKGEKSYQLRIYPPGSSVERPDEIIANVWNWDPGWKVEWVEDGVRKGEMAKYIGYDPLAYKNMYGVNLPSENGSLEPTLTEHIFSAKPSKNARLISVEVTDRFGNKHIESLDLAEVTK